jgi:hypothetical protein
MSVEGATRGYAAAPGLDEDRLSVLAAAGLTPEEIARLSSDGAFGPNG